MWFQHHRQRHVVTEGKVSFRQNIYWEKNSKQNHHNLYLNVHQRLKDISHEPQAPGEPLPHPSTLFLLYLDWTVSIPHGKKPLWDKIFDPFFFFCCCFEEWISSKAQSQAHWIKTQESHLLFVAVIKHLGSCGGGGGRCYCLALVCVHSPHARLHLLISSCTGVKNIGWVERADNIPGSLLPARFHYINVREWMAFQETLPAESKRIQT